MGGGGRGEGANWKQGLLSQVHFKGGSFSLDALAVYTRVGFPQNFSARV